MHLVPMVEQDARPPGGDGQSWDAFWAEQAGEVEYETIRGRRVEVPRDMPLRMLRQIERNAGQDATVGVVQTMAASLFGTETVDAWAEAGMGLREFRFVLRWGTEHAKGNPVTWQQAYDLVEEVEEAGKARPARTRSAGTGGRSRRTSPASTSSARKRSPA